MIKRLTGAIGERVAVGKDRVAYMVTRLLNLVGAEPSRDATDAMAAALRRANTELSPGAICERVAVGKGGADKDRVAYMVTRLLNLVGAEPSRDATDAMAAALCRANTELSPGAICERVAVGKGGADKDRVAYMATRLLNLVGAEPSRDATDAMAAALCRANTELSPGAARRPA